MSDTIVVIGATGAMGRPVVSHLLGDPERRWSVRAFTRDPSSPEARALAALGGGRVELARGDLDDPAALQAAFRGARGVFCNTNFFTAFGVQREYEQGVRALEAAREAGVEHFVYSSLDAASALTGGRLPVPHYDAKAAVEHFIALRRSDEFMRQDPQGWYSRSVSVLVTGPYYENFQSFFLPRRERLSDGREGLVFYLASGGRPYPMVALDDIAHFARLMFRDRAAWGGRTLAILGEAITIAEAAATFERVTGIAAEWRDVPLAAVREGAPGVGHDLANMFAFFQEGGVVRDLAALRRLHPGLLTFEGWLRKTGWRGESARVQKNAPAGPG
ncbi:MAG TPA: NmrA/HSCARG family protein [Polyangiaceae bacterium]|nr:NmrA/HSCARG family protein [Polyangiaceae bacterium]